MKRVLHFLSAISISILFLGCATVQIGTITKPAETDKLRIAVIPVSGLITQGAWGSSSESFSDNYYRITRKQLAKMGYYEVVPEAEMNAVLGSYVPERWDLIRNGSELARRIGTALYADYVLLIERGTLGEPHYYLEVTLINIESGQSFVVRLNNTRQRGEKKLPSGAGKAALRELFSDAKGDLLATALFKSRSQNEQQLEQHRSNEKKLADSGIIGVKSRTVESAGDEQGEAPQPAGAKRLIVYDLTAASNQLHSVALILSEALREEIQKRGLYHLVNRENIQQLLDEMQLQQSGLIDGSQVLRIGKGAGAQEIVTGNLGALGRTVVLHSKLTDIQSMLNISQASLKSDLGHEDQLLIRLAELVDQLLQPPKNGRH